MTGDIFISNNKIADNINSVVSHSVFVAFGVTTSVELVVSKIVNSEHVVLDISISSASGDLLRESTLP